MKNTYDICILGATALAAGIIAANPAKRIVVLETSSTIAGEFGDAWKSDSAAAYAEKTDAAASLRAEFVRRKALTDAGEWIPAIQPILADDIKKHGADVYFFAALKEIAAKDGVYAVTFNAFGINHSFTAAKVIDTTSRFIARPFLGGDVPEITAALHHVDASFGIHSTPCRDIKEGRAAIVRDYTNILKIASELAYSPAEARRDHGAAAWIPSSHYGNFLAAYDAGAQLILHEGAAETIVTETVDEGEYDVIIVGLGTAGGIAAVAALEEGLKVLGLENLSVAGGAGTAGNVLWPYFGFKGGIYMDLNRRGHARDGIFYPTNGDGADQKIVEFDASMQGADFRYGVQFTDVICEGSRVTGAVWYEAGVRHEARAKFVIDTSADSAACVSAGCAMLGGRDSDGRFQPYSSMYFRLANGRICGGYVDNGRMNQYDPDEFGSG
ncbi:MAG: FAD-dependent oxidoreductase, partial [Clostridia bacterium]|nr:FAD-dependent oxidoreductase [Clostridia bacterium]